jgi:hypothetical protein
MILEHGVDPVSAKWNIDHWDIGEKIKYRWNDSKNNPTSEWFYDIQEALTWIIQHNIKESK